MPNGSVDRSVKADRVTTRQPDGGAPTVSTLEVTVQWDTISWHGASTPGYFKKLRQGELIPMNSWTKTYVTGNAGGTYSVRSVPAKVTDTVTNWFYGAPASEVYVLNELNKLELEYDYLVQKAVANAYGQSHDTLTFLAELRQTISMFRSALERLIKFISGVPSHLKLESLWLEGRYGWRPFIYDIKEISKAFARLNEIETDIVTGRSNRSTSITYPDNNVYASDGCTSLIVRTKDVLQVSYGGIAALKADIPAFSFNPFVTGWELIKFSFVIDWFVSVGNAIAAISALVMSSDYSAARRTKATLLRNVTCVNPQAVGPCIGNIQMLQYDFTAGFNTTVLLRTPTTVPILPQIDVRLDFAKILDLIALLWQAINNRRR